MAIYHPPDKDILPTLILSLASVPSQGWLSMRYSIFNTETSICLQKQITSTSIKMKCTCTLAQGEPTALALLHLSVLSCTIDQFKLLFCLSSWFGCLWYRITLVYILSCQPLSDNQGQCYFAELCKVLYGMPQGSILGQVLGTKIKR